MLDSVAMEILSSESAALREQYLFSGLDENDYNSIVGASQRIALDKSEVLFHQGDAADHFYYVYSGQIELSLTAPTGQKKILEVLGDGRTFAEAVTFMRGRRYPVSAEALCDTVLCQIPSQQYVDLIYSNPDACMRLLSDISRHLHARVREIENLTVQNARGRLVSYLLDHVVETHEDEATIHLELPRHVIASRLSIMPETLSRLLRGMSDAGILSVEDRSIKVHSLAQLRPYG